jgi:hypothetical protein
MDPSRAAMMMGMTHELPPRPKVSQGAAGPVAQTASLARQARRLYVGNIPYGIDEVSQRYMCRGNELVSAKFRAIY